MFAATGNPWSLRATGSSPLILDSFFGTINELTRIKPTTSSLVEGDFGVCYNGLSERMQGLVEKIRRLPHGLNVESSESRNAGMKFSVHGLFSFEFSLAIPHFWKREPAGIATDYELERFFIAGFQYHDGPELVEELEAGTELIVIHEKDNPHDPRAVAFHLGGSHLGYVPRQQNRTIAALLDQGAPLRARITQVDSDADPWHAVEVVVFVIAGYALPAPGKGKEPFFPEL